MRLTHYGFLLTSMAVVMTSCSDDNPWVYGEGEGGISPRVAADAYVKDALPTRAAALAPSTENFGLRLTRNDGGFAQKWDSVNDFPIDKGFRSGAYTLEAFYGDIDDEGYNKPCYLGKTMFNVSSGQTSEVSVTASLANTMVDITYTEAFRNYFTSYSTTLHSEGHGYHDVLSSIDDAIYLAPGKVTVTVDFTKPNGQSATIQPAEFTAEARHFYHITLDVNNGEVGDAVLVVKFDDSVETEDVEIDLSDELLNLPAPEVTPKGFENGQSFSLLAGSEFPGQAAYSVFVPGTITSALMTIESDTYHPVFGNEIELANASPELQAQLADAGIRPIGLYKNPDRMATVDVAGLLSHLPKGDHKITLVVKDKLTRVNEPVTLHVSVSDVVLQFVSAGSVPVGQTAASMIVSYNGENLADKLTVKCLGDNGGLLDCDVVSVSEAAGKPARTRADEFVAKNYKVNLKTPATTRDMDVRLYYNGVEMSKGVIPRSIALSANAWATRSVLTVTAGTRDKLKEAVQSITFYNPSGNPIDEQYITRDASAGTVTISGLTPASHYTLTTSTSLGDSPTVEFSTEAALQPENGGMENWYSQEAIRVQTTGFGNTPLVWYPNSQGSSYWATRNATTTFTESGPTPFYVAYPGTYSVAGVSGKAAQICTVGWGEGSTFVAGNGGSRKNSSAGMLFMGSHSYSGPKNFSADGETFEFGRPFTSRPSSFSFDYTFAPYNGESFKAYAIVEHREGGNVTELARGELVSGTEVTAFRKATVNLNYTNTSLKATHAYIVFISSTAENPGNKNVQGSKGAFQGYSDARRTGNVLTVDNIQFNY